MSLFRFTLTPEQLSLRADQTDLVVLAVSVMQTRPPAEGSSSVLSRIHWNQVSQNFLSLCRCSHLHSCPTAVVLQLSHMTLCFSDIMRRHHAAQTAFRQKCKAQIRRQLQIGESDSEDVLDRSANSPVSTFQWTKRRQRRSSSRCWTAIVSPSSCHMSVLMT